MKKCTLLTLALAVFFFLTVFPLAAEEEGSGPDFGLGLVIGAQTFLDETTGESITYQELALSPDFAIGKFGIALDLTLHYRFTGDQESAVDIRREDWVPSAAGVGFLDLYLPKFRYVRYGTKGEPLFVKLGAIDDATLGTGFIMGGYDNTLFRPEEPVFGMNFDLDGNLFSFPYVGIETFFGNLTSFDVFGARLLGRPLIWSSIPILKNLEIGFTVAGDVAPEVRESYWTPADTLITETDPSIVIWGVDLIQPILSSPVFSLAAFGAVAVEKEASGGMIGFGGKVFSFLPYGFQLRFLGENFLPAYFDSTYDLTRGMRYVVVNGEAGTAIESSVGWLFSTGLSFFDDQLVFNANVDGPFEPIPEIPTESYADYPHLYMALKVAEGLIPGFFFNATYDKKFITSFADLIDPADAVIGASINYQTGPAVITLSYDLKYNPAFDPDDPESKRFTTTAKLSSSISMF